MLIYQRLSCKNGCFTSRNCDWGTGKQNMAMDQKPVPLVNIKVAGSSPQKIDGVIAFNPSQV